MFSNPLFSDPPPLPQSPSNNSLMSSFSAFVADPSATVWAMEQDDFMSTAQPMYHYSVPYNAASMHHSQHALHLPHSIEMKNMHFHQQPGTYSMLPTIPTRQISSSSNIFVSTPFPPTPHYSTASEASWSTLNKTNTDPKLVVGTPDSTSTSSPPSSLDPKSFGYEKPPTPLGTEPSFTRNKAKKRKTTSRKIACIICHQAKTSCNGQRPCDRCVRLSKTHLCVDRPSRLQMRKNLVESHADSNHTGLIGAPTATEQPPVPPPSQHQQPPGVPPRSASLDSSPSHSQQSCDVLDQSETDSLSESLDYDDFQDIPEGTSNSDSKFCESRLSRVGLRYFMDMICRPEFRAKLVKTADVIQFFFQLYCRSVLKEADMETLIHFGIHFFDEPAEKKPECVNLSELHAYRPNKKIPKPAWSYPCDGKICRGLCPLLRQWSETIHGRFTWAANTDAPLPDTPYNNFPCMIATAHVTEHPDSPATTFQDFKDSLREAVDSLITWDDLEKRTKETSDALAIVKSLNFTKQFAKPSPARFLKSTALVNIRLEVNTAFERLMGYSQSEMVEMFTREHTKAFFRLVRSDYWLRSIHMDNELHFGSKKDGSAFLVCVNKFGGEIHCLVRNEHVFSQNKFKRAMTTWIPLPDPRPPPRQQRPRKPHVDPTA